MRRVVSLSGGKDSTAMLLMMLERGERVDEVVVFDTGMEFPEMYEHLERLESYTGLGFTRLRMDPPFEHQMFVHRMVRGKREGQNGYGWPRPNARWCTTFKTRAMDAHIYAEVDGEHCIGIASDEVRRKLAPPPDATRSWNGASPRPTRSPTARNAGSTGAGCTSASGACRAGAARCNRSTTCAC